MTIALRRVDVSAVARPILAGGVIKASLLASADEAHGIVEQARREAARLLDDAQARVQDHLHQQRDALEERMWRNAADYSDAVGREWERSLVELEERITELLRRSLHRLVEQVPPDERLRACVQQLTAQAGTPDTGVLLLAEQDHASVLPMADTLPWPVQWSSDVPVGTARLVSTHGRWECGIDGALERLLEALDAQRQSETEDTDD